jgi:hypothetical protein
VAVAASTLVALGFAMFAVDELDKGSKAQQELLGQSTGQPAPSAAVERKRERHQGDVRELVDDANDVLLAPFTGVLNSDSAWAKRGVPALLALLAYGLGLNLLANYLPQQKAHGGDWRTAGD